MSKYAFTLLEIIFVLIVVGILAVVVIPRINRDSIFEAGEQVLSHIKYTQHLAMTDNVYQSDAKNWHFARWHIGFIKSIQCGVYCRVGSNRNRNETSGGNPNSNFAANEAAYDPLTRYPIYNDNLNCSQDKAWYNDVLLKRKYAIENDKFDMSSCNSQTIAFDHIGRPYYGFRKEQPSGKLLKENCDIVMEDSNGNRATITITAETGYAYITYN